jgi:hypothetical protein
MALVDVDTFLTTLSVRVDDFCKASLPPEHRPGPQTTLSQSAVVTLAVFGPWQGLGRERGFDRYAPRHWRAALPQLPAREPFTRQRRQPHEALVAFFLHLVALLAAPRCASEALDSSGGPPREAKRRGAGWLPGLAESGWSNRLGWYAGCHRLLAVTPVGALTGFGFGPASTKAPPWPRPAVPCVALPLLGCPALEPPPVAPMASIRALRAKRTKRWGGRPPGPRSSGHQSGRVGRHGRSPCGAGWPESGRASKRSTTSCCIPFAWTESGPMSSAGCGPVWRPRARGITSAGGCLNPWAGRGWRAQTWWIGNLIRFHTKR